ncbi:MAG: GH3 auxin-responsive promoter family protein, partial [Bacteroidetes bacterium]|nr:GH3 auxin-responsive promoter family protein [Bacteroidota bacterium]
TSLEYNGIYYAGDLSGITTGNLPFWFQPFYKPGKEISATKNWNDKLDLIVEQAHNWDVSAIVGVPAWFQLIMERLIAKHHVKNIHEIWPNLTVFTHGGVAFDPYKKSFEALLGKPLIYMETYLASEGFIAYQSHPDAEGMRLHIKNGIFFEFIPFNEKNVDEEGNVNPLAEAITIKDVEEDVEYILMLSTCAGAWRYSIGDVIKFTDKKKCEIKITGRTKHYLSLCGEHLSVENMNKAIEMVSEDMNIRIKEFTVCGVPQNSLFAHHWFVSVEGDVNKEILKNKIDFYIKELNDDYRIERQHSLGLKMDIVPNHFFLDWLAANGKVGAQIKFPRVLKREQKTNWLEFLRQQNVEIG